MRIKSDRVIFFFKRRRPVLLTTDPHYGTQYVREYSWRFDIFTLHSDTQGGTSSFFFFHSPGDPVLSHGRCKGLLDHCLASVAAAMPFT